MVQFPDVIGNHPDRYILHGRIRDIAGDVLDPVTGRFQILPASFWAGTTRPERAYFGTQNGIYSFPTVELAEYLRDIIGDRKAIEIGAGNGVLAETLGIIATDSFEQAKFSTRMYYEAAEAQTVPYGRDVRRITAFNAVRKFRPQVVLGCWVTHKMNIQAFQPTGHARGIDEEDILDHCEQYVFVGNEKVHENKKIWERPHTIEYPDFVYSRANNGAREFVAIFEGTAG